MRAVKVGTGFLGSKLLRRFKSEPLGALESLARPDAGLSVFRMGPYRAYLVNDPELIRSVLVTKAKCFRKYPRQTRLLARIDGQGLVVTEGELWRRQRRLVQPLFAPERLSGYVPRIVAQARALADAWQEGQRLDLVDESTQLTLRTTLDLLFGIEAEPAEMLRVAEAIKTLSEVFMIEANSLIQAPDWTPLPHKRRKRAALAVVDELIWRLIRERRAAPQQRDDLLSRLLGALDEGEDGDGRAMSDQQVRDEAITLFNAGHDTTAAGLAWVFSQLLSHPEWEERVRREAEAVLSADRESDLTSEAFDQLPATQAVVKESLRLYPPTWILFMRQALQDVHLGEECVKKGSLLFFSPWVTQRDERYFDQASSFDPERFLPPRADEIRPYTFIPFGEGPHKCIGMRLAMMEMTLASAAIVQRGSLRLDPAHPIEPDPVFAIRPRGGLPATWQRA